jgi:hypothetical protein
MSDNPVHNLKPGALGLVAHTMKSHELNGWVKTDVTIKVLPTTLVVDGEFYGLNVHIPHATFVLILSEHSLRTVYNSSVVRYYKVLWRDMICLIKRELLINFHVNEET